jgi:arylsulfatase A-like enzyme
LPSRFIFITTFSAIWLGGFDHGRDKQREITFERQEKLGVIPNDTKLTPRPDELPAWSKCSSDEKKLYARMYEVFAGVVEHVDAQIGKVVDALETLVSARTR